MTISEEFVLGLCVIEYLAAGVATARLAEKEGWWRDDGIALFFTFLFWPLFIVNAVISGK